MNYSKIALGAMSLALFGCGSDDSNEPTPIPNNPPAINLVSELSAKESSTITIDVDVSDADGTITSLEWAQISGIDVELKNADSSNVTLTLPDVNEDELIELSVTAVDDDGDSASASVVINVEQNVSSMTIDGIATDAPLVNATITLMLDGEETEFTTTTNSDGTYSLNIALDDSDINKFVSLKAKGNGAQSAAGLISLMGNFDTLLNDAGEDGVLEKSENSSSTISHISTAKYGLMRKASDDGVVFSESAVESLSKLVDANELLTLATAIKVAIDKAGSNSELLLPEEVTDTLALVEQKEAARAYVQKVVSTEEFVEAQTETLNDELLVNNEFNFPDAFELYMTAFSDLTAKSSAFKFNSDSTGKYHNHTFTWEVVDGKLIANFSEDSYSLSYPLIGDQQVEAWTGTKQLTIKVINHTNVTLDLMISRVGETLYPNNSEIPTETFESSYLTSASMGTEQFEALTEMVAYLPIGQVSTGSFQLSTFIGDQNINIATDRFVLNADGTGVGENSKIAVEWQFNNGQLELSFVSSDSDWNWQGDSPFNTLTFTKVASDTLSDLAHATVELSDSSEYFGDVERVILDANELAWSNDSAPGIYGYDKLWGESQFDAFWFELYPNGDADTLSSSDKNSDGVLTADEVYKMYGKWYIDGNELVITRYRIDGAGYDPECRETGLIEGKGECVLFHERRWRLLNAVDDKLLIFHKHMFDYTNYYMNYNIQTQYDIRSISRLEQAPVTISTTATE